MPQNLVGRFIVLSHHNAVEVDHPSQFGSHGAEKILRIAVRTNGLRYTDQRLITFGQQILGRNLAASGNLTDRSHLDTLSCHHDPLPFLMPGSLRAMHKPECAS